MTTYDSEYHGGGIPILKKLPHLPVIQLIEIALASLDMDDVTGASIELNERELYNNEEFRGQLLEKLLLLNTNGLSLFEKQRIKNIIYNCKLFDANNRKEIVGKHWTEIKKDADHYKAVAEQAKDILNKIEGIH